MFPKNLIQLRKSANKTQLDMSIILNISRAAYGSYEQGTREPDMETLQKIADFFKVSVDYLLGRSIDFNHINFNNFTFGTKPENTVVAIGRGGERVSYEISDEDVDLVNSFLEKVNKKK